MTSTRSTSRAFRSLRMPPEAAFSLLLVGTLAVPVTGCDFLKGKKTDKSESASNGATPQAGQPGTGPNAPKAATSAGCTFPEGGVIAADVTIKKGCTVSVKDNVTINDNATLRVEEGVTFQMDPGTHFWIENGRMIAKGSEKAPILFTSANATKAPGDWSGIGGTDRVAAGTEFEWVTIEYAGSATSNFEGALYFQEQRSPNRISIANCTFRYNEQTAVKNPWPKGAFAKFTNNKFSKNKSSLTAHPMVLASVGAGNTFGGDPLHTNGDVDDTATWPAFDTPIIVDEAVNVRGESAAPILTIQPKTILKFTGGSYLGVGEKSGGGLIAKGVTFTSANASPQDADWVGIFFYKRAAIVDLTGATIEYAGSDSQSGRGAITFHDTNAKDARAMKFTDLTIRHTKQSGIASADNDCGTLTTGVKVDGVPACLKP